MEVVVDSIVCSLVPIFMHAYISVVQSNLNIQVRISQQWKQLETNKVQ